MGLVVLLFMLSFPHDAFAGCNWSGEWDTLISGDPQPMSITQTGEWLSGTYANSRHMEGRDAFGRVSGAWVSTKDGGRFQLAIADDCASFAGTWGRGEEFAAEAWTGQRATRLPEATPPPTVEEVASGLRVPWSIEFARSGAIIYTEQPCRLVILGRRGSLPEPFEGRGADVPSTSSGNISVEVPGCVDAGDGVRGLALDPDDLRSPCSDVYLIFTVRRPNGALGTRLSRFTLDCTRRQLVDERVLVDGIPGGEFHTAGRLRFGLDGKLYLATGDALDVALPQDLRSLGGKMLRINTDGSVPSDNPIPGSYVYSLGHRNPQGLAWHPLTGDLWITDHGPSPTIEAEPFGCCHDEIDRVVPGGNYGWPIFAGVAGDSRFIDPVLESGQDTWAPSGAAMYRGPGPLAPWHGSLLYGGLIGEHLGRVSIPGPDFRTVSGHEKLLRGSFGRIREVAQGPDGFLYLTTSNTDGRSGAASRLGDDRILRVVAVPSLAERQSLVQGVYQEVLAREPDPTGLAAWSYTTHARSALGDLMGGSPEGQRVRAVRGAYLDFLFRDPLFDPQDPAGLRSWVESPIDVDTLVSTIASSPEAQRVAAIRALYVELAGRDPVAEDLAALHFWVASGASLDEIRAALRG